MCPGVEDVAHVRAGADLQARGDPRLHGVTIDGLEVDLWARHLLRLSQQLLAQEGVRHAAKTASSLRASGREAEMSAMRPPIDGEGTACGAREQVAAGNDRYLPGCACLRPKAGAAARRSARRCYGPLECATARASRINVVGRPSVRQKRICRGAGQTCTSLAPLGPAPCPLTDQLTGRIPIKTYLPSECRGACRPWGKARPTVRP